MRVTELARRAQQLREAAKTAGIDIRIVSGAEVSLVWALEASDEQLALATYDQGGTDLLIETPTFNVDWPREPAVPAAGARGFGSRSPILSAASTSSAIRSASSIWSARGSCFR